MPPLQGYMHAYTSLCIAREDKVCSFPSSEQRTLIRLSTREATFIAERFIHLIGRAAIPCSCGWVLPRSCSCDCPPACLLDQPTLYQCLRKSSLDLTKTHPLLQGFSRPCKVCCHPWILTGDLNASGGAAAIYSQGVGCVFTGFCRQTRDEQALNSSC